MSAEDALQSMISPTRRATMSIAEERTQAQKNTFAKWANSVLATRNLRVDDLCVDFADGVHLIQLAELLTEKKAGKHSPNPQAFFAKSANLSIAFDLFHADGLRLVNIGPQDILERNEKITLALFWSLILRYQIVKKQSDDASFDSDSSAKKLLLEWIRGLPNFEAPVNNFNNSWTSGEALWDLVDCVSDGALSDMDRTRSPTKDIATAMRVAEDELGVPQLLSPEHMAKASDELSLMTYISFFKEKMDNVNRAKEEAAKELANVDERDFLEEEADEDDQDLESGEEAAKKPVANTDERGFVEEEADENEDGDSGSEAADVELINIDELEVGSSSASSGENSDDSRDGGHASHAEEVHTDFLDTGGRYDSDGILQGKSPFESDDFSDEFDVDAELHPLAGGGNPPNSMPGNTAGRTESAEYEVPPVAAYESDTSDSNAPSMLANKVISPRVGLNRPLVVKEDRLSDLSVASAGQHTDTSLASHIGGSSKAADSWSLKAAQLTPRGGRNSSTLLTPRGATEIQSQKHLSPASQAHISPHRVSDSTSRQVASPRSEPVPSKPVASQGRSGRGDQEHLIGREVNNSLRRPTKRPSSAATQRRLARDKARALHNRGRSVTFPASLQKDEAPSKSHRRRNTMSAPESAPSLEFDTDGRPSVPAWMSELGLLPPASTKTPRNSGTGGDYHGAQNVSKPAVGLGGTQTYSKHMDDSGAGARHRNVPERFPASIDSGLPLRSDQKHIDDSGTVTGGYRSVTERFPTPASLPIRSNQRHISHERTKSALPMRSNERYISHERTKSELPTRSDQRHISHERTKSELPMRGDQRHISHERTLSTTASDLPMRSKTEIPMQNDQKYISHARTKSALPIRTKSEFPMRSDQRHISHERTMSTTASDLLKRSYDWLSQLEVDERARPKANAKANAKANVKAKRPHTRSKTAAFSRRDLAALRTSGAVADGDAARGKPPLTPRRRKAKGGGRSDSKAKAKSHSHRRHKSVGAAPRDASQQLTPFEVWCMESAEASMASRRDEQVAKPAASRGQVAKSAAGRGQVAKSAADRGQVAKPSVASRHGNDFDFGTPAPPRYGKKNSGKIDFIFDDNIPVVGRLKRTQSVPARHREKSSSAFQNLARVQSDIPTRDFQIGNSVFTHEAAPTPQSTPAPHTMSARSNIPTRDFARGNSVFTNESAPTPQSTPAPHTISDIGTREFQIGNNVFTNESAPTPQSTPAPHMMSTRSDDIRMQNSLDESSISAAHNSNSTVVHPQTYTPAQTLEPFSQFHGPPRERHLSVDDDMSHEVKTPNPTPVPPTMSPLPDEIRMENALDESSMHSASQSSVNRVTHHQTYTPAQTPEPFSQTQNPPRERHLSVDDGMSHEVNTPNPTPAPPTMSPLPDEIRMENALDESNMHSAGQSSVNRVTHPQTYTPAQTPEPFSQFQNPPRESQAPPNSVASPEVKTPNPTPAPVESMTAKQIQQAALDVLSDALLASPRFREAAHASPPPRRSLPGNDQLTPIRDKVFEFPALYTSGDGSDADSLPSPVKTTKQHFGPTGQASTPKGVSTRQTLQHLERSQTVPNSAQSGGIHTPRARRSLRDASRQLSLALQESEESKGGSPGAGARSRDLSQHPLLMTPMSRERRRQEVLGTIVEDETSAMIHSAPVTRASSKRNSLSRPAQSNGRARLRARKQFADMKRDASLNRVGSDIDVNVSDVSSTERENRLRDASHTPGRKGYTDANVSDHSQLKPLGVEIPETPSANRDAFDYAGMSSANESPVNLSPRRLRDSDARESELQRKEEHLSYVQRSMAIIQELEPERCHHKLVVLESQSLGFSYEHQSSRVSGGRSPSSSLGVLHVPQEEKISPLETPRTPLAVASLRRASVSSLSETEPELTPREESLNSSSKAADPSNASSRGVFSFSHGARTSNAQIFDPNTPRAVHLDSGALFSIEDAGSASEDAASLMSEHAASQTSEDAGSTSEDATSLMSEHAMSLMPEHATSPASSSGSIIVTSVAPHSGVAQRGIKPGDVVELVQAQPASLELLIENEEVLKRDADHKVCVVFRCPTAKKRPVASRMKSRRESVDRVRRGSTSASSEPEFDADEAFSALNPMWDPPLVNSQKPPQRSLRGESTSASSDIEFDATEALSALNPMWDPPPFKPRRLPQRSIRRVKAKRPLRSIARKPPTLPASLSRPSRLKKRPGAARNAVSSKPTAEDSNNENQEGSTSFLSKLATLLMTLALLCAVFAAGYRAGSGSVDHFSTPPVAPIVDDPDPDTAVVDDMNFLAVSTVIGTHPHADDEPFESGVRAASDNLDLTHVEETQDLILDRLDDLEDVVKKRTAAIMRAKRERDLGYLSQFTSYVGNFFG